MLEEVHLGPRDDLDVEKCASDVQFLKDKKEQAPNFKDKKEAAINIEELKTGWRHHYVAVGQ